MTNYWHGIDFTVERPNGQRAGAAGWHQHRTRGSRFVRHHCALPEIFLTVGPPRQQQIDRCARRRSVADELPRAGTYTIPSSRRAGERRSALAGQRPAHDRSTAFVATNGASLTANYTLTNAILQRARSAPARPRFASQTLDLTLPGQLYGERVNSVDMRFAKILRIRRHTDEHRVRPVQPVQLERGTAYNQGFGTDGSTWLRPTADLNPRFAALQRDVRLLSSRQ